MTNRTRTQWYGRIFLRLWRLYLRQLSNVERNHPFAFISFQGSNAGGTSAEYQALVRAWSEFAASGRTTAVAPSKAQGEDALLLKIPDPAVRALVGAAIAERNRLRAEVNVLKAASNIVVDRRQGITQAPSAVVNGVEVFEPRPQLTDTERRALEKAVSAPFLHGEGWTEGPLGEIRNARGRNVFDVGFSTAVRKVLCETGSQ